MKPCHVLQQLCHWLSLLALFSLGLLFAASTEAGRSVRRLTKADNHSTVHLRPGERLEIALSGNPTTGYSWAVSSVDGTVLQLLGEPAYRPSSINTGAGGEFAFMFEAQQPGQTTLRLAYCRPWEKGKQAVESFEAVIACSA